ncbi:FAD-binding oxidoreductase [Gammaproteobacteria bacterium]|nr:FAD-binding oxidoreductase [Gammaproteobacteria bacterium]
MTNSKKICGWGRYPQQESLVLTPSSLVSLNSTVRQETSIIARGMGRCYGDSANSPKVLQTLNIDHFIEFDELTGKLTAEAGITLRDILRVIVPKGWFLPVTPGTSYVTLGGAIASDVHGKNHHVAGTFGQHVAYLNILLGTGEVVTTSPQVHPDLFHATCGGMGLTGIIINATIQLLPIRSSLINQKTIKADCIEAACEAFETNCYSTYSVAWIDCLSQGKNLGRSILMLGEHIEQGELEIDVRQKVSIPFSTPSSLLNSLTIKAFNTAYWHKSKHNQNKTVSLMPYFYPLDVVGEWNKLYGKKGFLQFQCVLPKTDGIANMRKLLTEISNSGEGSFLAVLKQFGGANKNLLSFPTEGYTIALDFKLSSSTLKTVSRLEEMTVDMGGRLYLTKDAVMEEKTFKTTYPNWKKFEEVRRKYGAIGKFSSSQSKRLGLA